MTISFISGNILKSDSDYIVNTVNCVGVMGKGLALQIKKKFPAEFSEYKKSCDAGELSPGSVYVFNEMFNPVIIHMTTKNHWINPSKIEYIQDSLKALKEYFSSETDHRSVALPAIGCGNGGLNWSDVRELILKELDDMNDNIDVYVYEPTA